MDLEYLIVGIARGEEEDYHNLYLQTYRTVFALSLSIVKDKGLARCIAVETYRRVAKQAYLFDTELNAEYWILDIARHLSVNALQDPQLKALADGQKADNLTFLLQETIYHLKNERGTLLLLHALSGLSRKDIAKLLWYYQQSASNEYRRAVAELKKREFPDKTQYRRRADILAQLKKDAQACTPDYWDLILSDMPSKAEHISHEEINLSDEEAAFTQEDQKLYRLKKEAARARRIKMTRNLLLCAAAAVCAAAVVFLVVRLVRKGGEAVNPGPSSDESAAQHGNTLALVENDGYVYYQGKDNCLYKRALSASDSEPVKISDHFVKELLTDGRYLFYRNNTDGKMYRCAFDGSNPICLAPVSGAAMALYGDCVYFSGNNGIYCVPKDGVQREEEIRQVLSTEGDSNLFRYDINIAGDGTIYFSSGAGKGLHRVTDFQGTPSTEGLYLDEVYLFTIEGDYLYFDVLYQSVLLLYRVDLRDDTITVVGQTVPADPEQRPVNHVYLTTGAYDVYGTDIYYYGYQISDSGDRFDYGLYKISAGGAPELLFSYQDDAVYISDIHVTETMIYCFYSDGKKDGIRKLTAFPRNALDKAVILF